MKDHLIFRNGIDLDISSTLPRIHTNDLKKGDWIILRDGWLAEVWDNKKGNTRVCDVYGFAHEAGSVYSHDILAKVSVYSFEKDGNPIGGPHYQSTLAVIVHTASQMKLRAQVNVMAKEA